MLQYMYDGDVEGLRSVLQADPTRVDETHQSYTALIMASERGDAAGLKLLLETKANANHQIHAGYTGLVYAAQRGHADCLKLLVDAKANVNFVDASYNTGLTHAAYNNNLDCVEILVEAKADLEFGSEIGNGPLKWASTKGHWRCLSSLLEAKATVDSPGFNNNTGLLWSSQNGHMECVKLLLESKANADHRNKDGDNAVRMCREDGTLLQFLLVACGAQVEHGLSHSLVQVKTRIALFHSELKSTLRNKVIVDTRIGLEEHGLYHEPLERVMQYCGFDLMVQGDPNIDQADPIPHLLRGRQQRIDSAIYWWTHFIQ